MSLSIQDYKSCVKWKPMTFSQSKHRRTKIFECLNACTQHAVFIRAPRVPNIQLCGSNDPPHMQLPPTTNVR